MMSPSAAAPPELREHGTNAAAIDLSSIEPRGEEALVLRSVKSVFQSERSAWTTSGAQEQQRLLAAVALHAHHQVALFGNGSKICSSASAKPASFRRWLCPRGERVVARSAWWSPPAL
jgi:hypothetical protein